jgi:hypothetical protein
VLPQPLCNASVVFKRACLPCVVRCAVRLVRSHSIRLWAQDGVGQISPQFVRYDWSVVVNPPGVAVLYRPADVRAQARLRPLDAGMQACRGVFPGCHPCLGLCFLSLTRVGFPSFCVFRGPAAPPPPTPVHTNIAPTTTTTTTTTSNAPIAGQSSGASRASFVFAAIWPDSDTPVNEGVSYEMQLVGDADAVLGAFHTPEECTVSGAELANASVPLANRDCVRPGCNGEQCGSRAAGRRTRSRSRPRIRAPAVCTSAALPRRL